MPTLVLRSLLLLALVGLLLTGCSSSDSSAPAESITDGGLQPTRGGALTGTVLTNQAPYLPPQCYTKTVQADGAVRNSCYTCHTKGLRPDFVNDGDLQLEFAFPAYAEQNHWTNLLVDRRSVQTQIADTDILDYIRTSNYFDAEGRIVPAADLAELPQQWDPDGDGVWSGYVPDCYFNFDEAGFDHDPSGGYTGWRALAYYPFPATHWPANGDYGDVMIRLPDAFQTRQQVFDPDVYRTNLAILEALIKKSDVAIPPTDENRYQVDLDKDGRLATACRITYDWAPNDDRQMRYVGDAGELQAAGEVQLAAGLFPEGTEFLNTLRYVDITEEGEIAMADRMKEIRYARKIRWLTYAQLETLALNEVKERDDFPDRLKLPIGNMEDGVSNGVGWVWQGFIEDAGGRLRPQTFEETASCIGCHGGIGATTDSTFAFARKLDAGVDRQGWYHWSHKDLVGLNEPKVRFERAGVQYEYAYYLMYAGAGDEFASNAEVRGAFFDENGTLKPEMAAALHEDLSLLLYPSSDRALALNKAYRQIVEEQRYNAGRTALLDGGGGVFATLTPEDVETRVATPLILAAQTRDRGCRPCLELATEPVAADLQTVIDGSGMAGPDGQRYQIDDRGLIDESTYAATVQGVYFPFPPRHTLPTRMIVPLGSIPVCYECHRLDRTVPPDNPNVTVPVAFEETLGLEDDLEFVQLTNDAAADINGVWSPDGTQILWETDRGGEFQIWVMNSDGSQKRAVTQGPAIHGWPRWHPDGSRIVYWGYDPVSGMYTIATAAADGSDEKIIAESDEMLDRPQWRPDGSAIAWGAQTDGNWDIWAADSTGSELHRLTYDAQMESNPLWRPDGSTISYKVAPNKEYNLTIENFMNIDSGFDSPTVRVWDGIKSIQMNDWSPDGSQIAYTAEIVTNASGEDRVSYLAVVEDVTLSGARTSGSPKILSAHNTLGDRGPVFSPDGSQIAFWAWDKSYRATLWLVGSDGNGLMQLTRLGPDMTPQWHPDGTRLLFESARGGNMDIWTVGVD
jgi:Tol biopolymer transport system component